MIRPLIAGLALIVAGCGGGESVPATIAIDNVTLIDGTDGGARPGMTVAIADDRIVAVGPTDEVRLGDVPTRIDGSGMYLIPGLWDMHVHLFGYRERALPLFLANGVTTIRDVGGDLTDTGWLRQEIRFGRLLGPDMLISGPVLDAPILAALMPAGRLSVPTPEMARVAVDSLARVGVDVIKVHSLTPRAAYFAILDEASKRGIPVVGHVPDSVTITEAIDSGHRTIEHSWGIPIVNSARGGAIVASLQAAIARHTAGTGERARRPGPLFDARLAAADSASASYDSASAAQFAEYAASKRVWFDPTLVVLRTQALRNDRAIRTPDELRFAPRAVLEFDEGLPVKANPTAADLEAGRRDWDATRRTFRELVRAGAKFLAGTDVPVMPLVPGFSLHRELEALVEIGLTPLQALQAATRNAAASMGEERNGLVAVGSPASMVLLRSDPLASIGNVRDVQVVIVRGRLLDRPTLDRFLQDAESFARQRP